MAAMRPARATTPIPPSRSATGCASRPRRRRSAAGAGERLDVDVAIVGGGFTGLWTAIALTDTDPSLRVVGPRGGDRRVRGERPERRLLRGEPDPRPGQRDPPLPRRARAARARGHRQPAGPRSRSPATHGIDCDLEETGDAAARRPAVPGRGVPGVGRRGRRARRDARVPGPGRRPGRGPLPALAGRPVPAAGPRRPRRPGQAVPRPRPRRARARRRDPRAHPASPASSGAPAASTSATGDGATVRAAQVVVATSAYSGWLRRLSPLFVPVYDYVLVSEPLTPDQRRVDRLGAAPGPVRREQPVPLLPADRRRPDPVGRLRRDPLLRAAGSARSSTGGRRRSRSSRPSSSGPSRSSTGCASRIAGAARSTRPRGSRSRSARRWAAG